MGPDPSSQMPDERPESKIKREISMSAKATIELFGNGAVAKTKERLAEVIAEGNQDSIDFWTQLLEEVSRLHRLRHDF